MRLMPIVTAALLVTAARPAAAQEWIDFVSRQDRFTCNFPSEPRVTETTYKSEYGADLPARVYTATQGQSRYTMTVVDYNQAQRILTEKTKPCLQGDERCNGGGETGEGYWKNDIRGALVYAAWQFMQRDARITLYLWNMMDRVEGQLLQLTNNRDKSRTFASLYMHENKLYIMEGTVPAGYPEPGLFQQSLGWVDEKGVGVRYQSVYINGVPAPPRVNRGGQAQGANPYQSGAGR